MLVNLYATILLYSHQAESGLHFDIKFIWVNGMHMSHTGQKHQNFDLKKIYFSDIFDFM